MYTRPDKEESDIYHLAARFSRELRGKVSKAQYIDVVYGVHFVPSLQKIVNQAMNRAWKKVFGKNMGHDASTIYIVERTILVFKKQAQDAYERFHLVRIVGEA